MYCSPFCVELNLQLVTRNCFFQSNHQFIRDAGELFDMSQNIQPQQIHGLFILLINGAFAVQHHNAGFYKVHDELIIFLSLCRFLFYIVQNTCDTVQHDIDHGRIARGGMFIKTNSGVVVFDGVEQKGYLPGIKSVQAVKPAYGNKE